MSSIDGFCEVPESAPGMIVHHENDDGVVLSAAVGVRLFGGPTLTLGDGFQIASVTKPYTASVVLQLHEEGVLDLDERAARWLDDDLVAQLLIVDGESFGDRLTIRHLINHTSGLADRDDDFAAEALSDPDRVWGPRTSCNGRSTTRPRCSSPARAALMRTMDTCCSP